MKKQGLVVDISEEAREIMRNIYFYTADNWGMQQAEKYSAMLDDAFVKLANYPALGHKRSDIPSNYLAYSVGRHVIIYRISEKILHIISIFHQHMDIEAQLTDFNTKKIIH